MKLLRPFKPVIDFFQEKYDDIVHAFKHPSVFGFFCLAPHAVCVFSFLFALIQLIRFFVIQGYQAQSGLFDFTAGTAPDYYNGIFCIAMGVLTFIGIAAGLIEFFREEKTWRKVLTSIAFALSFVCFGLGLADAYVNYADGDPLHDTGFLPEQLHKPFRSIHPDFNFDAVLLLAALVFLIAAVVLLWTSHIKIKERFLAAIIAALVSFAGFPLVLLLIENLLTLILAGILIVAAPIVILCKAFAVSSGPSSGSGSSVRSGSADSFNGGRSWPEAQETSQEASPEVSQKASQKVPLIEIARNTRSIQREGNTFYIPLSNTFRLFIRDGKVYSVNSGGSENHIWNEQGFKRGECKFLDAYTGKEITWNDIEKRK